MRGGHVKTHPANLPEILSPVWTFGKAFCGSCARDFRCVTLGATQRSRRPSVRLSTAVRARMGSAQGFIAHSVVIGQLLDEAVSTSPVSLPRETKTRGHESALGSFATRGAVWIFVAARQALQMLLDGFLFRPNTCFGTHSVDTPGVPGHVLKIRQADGSGNWGRSGHCIMWTMKGSPVGFCRLHGNPLAFEPWDQTVLEAFWAEICVYSCRVAALRIAHSLLKADFYLKEVIRSPFIDLLASHVARRPFLHDLLDNLGLFYRFLVEHGSALPHDPDHHTLDLDLHRVEVQRFKPLVAGLQPHSVPLKIVALDCREVADLCNDHLAALRTLPSQHDDVVPVEDPFVVHRIPDDTEDVVISTARVEKVGGNGDAGVVHRALAFFLTNVLVRVWCYENPVVLWIEIIGRWLDLQYNRNPGTLRKRIQNLYDLVPPINALVSIRVVKNARVWSISARLLVRCKVATDSGAGDNGSCVHASELYHTCGTLSTASSAFLRGTVA